MKLETLKDYVQSANINFLIGSGLSRPFLPTLGNIENQLSQIKDIPCDKRRAVVATLFREYFKRVIEPNLNRGEKAKGYIDTLKNYQVFLRTWNSIIHNRCSSLRSKQINLFSTNIDLLVEDAVESVGVEFNDGFIGSVKPVFNEANFQKTIRKESIHFHNSTELPVFNLMKMHGSINWRDQEGCLTNDYQLSLIEETRRTLEKFTDNDYPKYSDDITDIAKQVCKDVDYSAFLNQYQQFQIVNPTKRKFSQSVLDVHFYELMRMFSNNLEKENTLLFVMGFSFADEHIRSIVKRALKTNPTLLVIVFSYSDEEVAAFKEYLDDDSNNLMIISPSSYSDENRKEGESRVEKFDFESINSVFTDLLTMIPIQFGDDKQ